MIKVLLVDDSPDNIRLLYRSLQDNDKYKLYFALTAEKLFHILSKATPDIIILDLIMPKMSGFEILQELKKDERLHKIPVIVYSALKDTKHQVRCYELGAAHFLVKPVETQLMAAVIDATVSLIHRCSIQCGKYGTTECTIHPDISSDII